MTMTARPLTSGLLTVAQAAAELGVSPATIRRACDAGVVPCRRSPGGHRRFERSALAGLTRDQVIGGARAGQGAAGIVVRALADLGEAAIHWEDIGELLRAVAAHMLAATGAATVDIYRLEEEGVFRCLVSLDREGPDDPATGGVLRVEVFPIAGLAIRDGSAVVVADRSDERLTDADREVYDEYGFASEALVPLLVDDRVVGIIDLYADRPEAFADSLDYLRGAAHIAAGALEKALLVSELSDRNDNLRDLLQLAGLLSQTHDQERLIRAVAERVRTVTGASVCEIFRREGDEYRALVSSARDGFDEAAVGRLLDRLASGSTMAALAERRTLVVADVADSDLSEDERAGLLGQGFISELLIPLVLDGEVVGFIDLFDEAPRDWQDSMVFAAGVSQLVAGALDKADLVKQLEGSNQELRTLAEGGLEFGSTLDTDLVLLSIARKMRLATTASSCDIYTVDGDRLRAVVAVDHADTPDTEYAGKEFPVAGFPLSATSIRLREPIVVEDITTDPRATELERRTWGGFGLRSGVIVPLISGAQVVGVASVYDREPRGFANLDLLRGLGQVAGQAIANAALYEALDHSARRAAVLNQLSAELAQSREPQVLLEILVGRLRGALEASECAAFRLMDSGVLECSAASAADDLPAPLARGASYALEDSPVTRLAIDGRCAAAASLEDPRLGARARTALRRRGVRSYLVAPLVAQGAVYGTVELADTRATRAFSREETGLVEAACRVAGLAVDNALLFADLERRSREAELINEVARRTAASLDLGDITDAAVKGLDRLVPVSSYGLALREAGEFRFVHGPASVGPMATVGFSATAAGGALFEQLERDGFVVVDGDPAIAPEALRQMTRGARAAAAIGLFERQELIGVLMLASEEHDAFATLGRSALERLGVHLSLAAHNARLYQEIKSLHLGNLKGLSTALNAKDYYTLGHAARVAAYMVLLGRELGWRPDEVEQVREAAYLHDIGKIGVSDRVLLKQGPLNEREWEMMWQHPVVSAEIIGPLFPEHLVAAVRHHHERYDGEGYPDGLAGDAIPELARAMCVVDSYDAMSLQRPYRNALTAQQCLEELRRCRGRQFDPGMTDAFVRVLRTLAELRDAATRAAEKAAARIDPAGHAKLVSAPAAPDRPEYQSIQVVLREVRDAHPEVRFVTTEAYVDGRCAIIVDAEETGSEDYSPPGEEVMVDDAARRILAGRSIVSNVLFVDNFGVWVNGLAPLRDDHGQIVAAVVADAPALGATGAGGFARLTTDTPVGTLQEAAVRLSRAEIEAITDGLTGLYNHRYLHERLTEELDRARREERPLSVLFCDLDFFKDFNDRLGHAAGDDALRTAARLIERCTRRSDVTARYGGEEFVVVLTEAAEPEAVEIAGRIRAAVAEQYREGGELTISIGVASYPGHADGKEALLEAADRAMYVAKRLGRDRVVTAGSLGG